MNIVLTSSPLENIKFLMTKGPVVPPPSLSLMWQHLFLLFSQAHYLFFLCPELQGTFFVSVTYFPSPHSTAGSLFLPR